MKRLAQVVLLLLEPPLLTVQVSAVQLAFGAVLPLAEQTLSGSVKVTVGFVGVAGKVTDSVATPAQVAITGACSTVRVPQLEMLLGVTPPQVTVGTGAKVPFSRVAGGRVVPQFGVPTAPEEQLIVGSAGLA